MSTAMNAGARSFKGYCAQAAVRIVSRCDNEGLACTLALWPQDHPEQEITACGHELTDDAFWAAVDEANARCRFDVESCATAADKPLYLEEQVDPFFRLAALDTFFLSSYRCIGSTSSRQ